MPYDSSNFGYRTLPVWLQDFVAGLGPSTMANLRRGFQQEIVRPGVRINFDREFANRNSSLSEVLSQVFTQPGNNALVPGRIFNPINQGQPSDPSIPPFLPIRPDLPTSPPPPSGGSGGSGSGGSGGSGSGSSVPYCTGSGTFGSICQPDCLNEFGINTCGPNLPQMGDVPPGTSSVCAATRIDPLTSLSVPLCACSEWQIQATYFSWDGLDCFNGFPVMGYTGEVVQIYLGFCCYEALGVVGYATIYRLSEDDLTPGAYIQYQVVGEPDPLDVAEFMKQAAESACPGGDCGGHIPTWTSCGSAWEVLAAWGGRTCPTGYGLPPYNAFP